MSVSLYVLIEWLCVCLFFSLWVVLFIFIFFLMEWVLNRLITGCWYYLHDLCTSKCKSPDVFSILKELSGLYSACYCDLTRMNFNWMLMITLLFMYLQRVISRFYLFLAIFKELSVIWLFLFICDLTQRNFSRFALDCLHMFNMLSVQTCILLKFINVMFLKEKEKRKKKKRICKTYVWQSLMLGVHFSTSLAISLYCHQLELLCHSFKEENYSYHETIW